MSDRKFTPAIETLYMICLLAASVVGFFGLVFSSCRIVEQRQASLTPLLFLFICFQSAISWLRELENEQLALAKAEAPNE